MDYSLIVSELQKASTFDLYRLQAAIAKLLEDPVRVVAIKRQLRPGMAITYFHQEENRLIPARLLALRKTRAVVQDLEGERRWTIPLFMINLQGADTDIAPRRDGVDRLSLRIGDTVGFTAHDGEALFGTVVKLNPKRAKIQTTKGVWAVPYARLFTVIDGEQAGDPRIPPQLTHP